MSDDDKPALENPDEDARVFEFNTLKASVAGLEKRDREASEYVESVLCMRTHFTGDFPYVGWKGLGLALNEALDDKNVMKAALEEILTLKDDEGKLAKAFARGAFRLIPESRR